jgi:hypothetical protein
VATIERTDPLVGGRLADDNQKPVPSSSIWTPTSRPVPRFSDCGFDCSTMLGDPFCPATSKPLHFLISGCASRRRRTRCRGPPYISRSSTMSNFYDTESRIAVELKVGSSDGKLPIKFNVDGYDINSSSETFTWGRIAGSIGCYHEAEPRHLVAGRRLRRQVGGPLQHAPCHLDIRDKAAHRLG